jgi:hypothetical protein
MQGPPAQLRRGALAAAREAQRKAMIPLPDAATAPRSPPHVLVWDLDALMLAPSLTELLAPWSGAGVGDGRGSDAGDGDGLAVGGAAAASGSAAAVMVDMFDGDEEEGEEGGETGIGGARRAAVRLRRAERALLRSCFFYDAVAPYDSHLCAADAQQYDDNLPLARASLLGDAFLEAAGAAAKAASAAAAGGAASAAGVGGAAAAFARRQAAILRRMMLPPAALRALSYRYRIATTTYREWRDRLASRDEHAMGIMPLPMTRQDSLDAVMPLPLGPEEVRAQRVLGGFLKRACGLPLRTDVNATLAAATKAGYTNVLVSEALPLLRVLAAALLSGCSRHFAPDRVYSAETDPLGSCLLRIRAQFGPQCKLAFVTPGVEAVPRRCVRCLPRPRRGVRRGRARSALCPRFRSLRALSIAAPRFIFLPHSPPRRCPRVPRAIRRALLEGMLNDNDAGGAVSSESCAAAASGGEDAARALNVAVLRVASSKHMRDLRGALAMQGRGGLDSVIAAFARADGDGDVEEMIGASDDEVDDGSSGSYMSDDDGSREEEEGAEEELSPQGR